MVLSGPKFLLHAEGLLVLAASCFAYWKLGGSWGYFALLFFAPDLSMMGYLAGRKIGAVSYNSAHTYLTPAGLAAAAYVADGTKWLWVAAIWAAHIGFDRLLGYGLKYSTSFKDTHLHRS